MSQKYLLFLFTIFIGFNCHSQTKEHQVLLKKLAGQWQYTESSGGFTGKGTGWTDKKNTWINFKKNGCYRRCENGKIVEKSTYKLTKQKTILSEESLPVIDYKVAPDQAYEIKGDTLILKDNVSDGYQYIYIKK